MNHVLIEYYYAIVVIHHKSPVHGQRGVSHDYVHVQVVVDTLGEKLGYLTKDASKFGQ